MSKVRRMPRRTLPLVVLVTAALGLSACGDQDDGRRPPAVPAGAGAPQGPAPRAGLQGGDLPTGATLTGAPARALARVGDKVYAAGVQWVATLRGSALAFSARSGELAQAFGTNGEVTDVLPDGRGGVFLAGSFDRVGARRRSALVHVFSTGELDRRFRPRLEGPVTALALEGPILYAGGAPRGRIGPGARGLVALSAGTGAPVAGFESDLAPPITALEVRDGTLWAGGSAPGLRAVEPGPDASGAAPAAPLVAIDARTGARREGFAPASIPGTVGVLKVLDGKLWVGTGSGSRDGPALRLLEPTSGATVGEPSVRGSVHALLPDGRRVVALGALRARRGGRDLAQALDRASGERRGAFAVPASAAGGDTAVAFDGVLRGEELWLGGRSGRAGSGFVGAYRARSGAPMPQVAAGVPDGPVRALASAGGRIVVGGDLAALDVRRQDLVAFDATTGRYAAGARLPATRRVTALVGAGGRLWLVDGGRLLGVAPATGAVVARVALPGGAAAARGLRLTAAGGRIFVSGPGLGDGVLAVDAATGREVAFELPPAPVLVGGADTLWVAARGEGGRSALARYDARTGRRDERFAAEVDGRVRALTLAGDRLYLAGAFDQVGDLSRANLAAVDAGTGAPLPEFEPGPARAPDGVRLERLGDALLVRPASGIPRAYAADGGPETPTRRGAWRVSATAEVAGGAQLVAGSLRRSALHPADADPERGVILVPRGGPR